MKSKLESVFKSKWKFRYFQLMKLPSLFFWGIKVHHIDIDRAEVTIPYRWTTQNPFGSIYFSAIAGAAELSTGLLAFLAIEGNDVSFLVVGVNGKFYKKASTKTVFICDQGQVIRDSISKAISSGQGEILTVKSAGYNEQKELVAEFEFTWSFKKRD
jgi:acyl-coenzyme A thioesterase PaaI-like protein